ncbi:MAG: EamA family transporter [Patescibacteria group bacterium]
MPPFIYLVGTILFTVIAQIIMKWAVPSFGPLPESASKLLPFFFRLITNIYFVSALFSALLGSFCWVFALNKYALSFGYPFMSLSFVLVFLASHFIFGESISMLRWVGMGTVILGVFLISRS